ALAPCVVGAVVERPQFFRSYLVAWLFWLAVTLGCWAWMMVHNLTGGGWGRAARPALEAGTATLPLMVLLFLPLLFGLQGLYPWARPGAASDPLLQQKQAYLNVPFFVGRTAGYFAAWLALTALMR